MPEYWINLNERYSVSSYGRVRSNEIEYRDSRNRKRGKKGRVLKPATRSDGYLVVNVSGLGRKRNWKVHQLVAYAFLSNPQNKPCINHKDGDKTNNHVDNLEYCTHSENAKHAFSIGLRQPTCNSGESNGNSKVIVDLNAGVFYETIGEAAAIYGYKQSTLAAMLRGQNRNKTSLEYA